MEPQAKTATPAAAGEREARPEQRNDQRNDRGPREPRPDINSGNIGAAPTNLALNTNQEVKKKYCRFKKAGIKYIDYKDPDFLLKFVNDQGKILPRRLTGTSLKYQRRLSVAIKRARHLALLPFVTDALKKD